MAALEPQTLSAASSCEGKGVWCPDCLVGSWPREGSLCRSFASLLSSSASQTPRQLGVASKGKGGGSLGLRPVFVRNLGGERA